VLSSSEITTELVEVMNSVEGRRDLPESISLLLDPNYLGLFYIPPGHLAVAENLLHFTEVVLCVLDRDECYS